MSYIGDFRAGKTVTYSWSSNGAAGESITRATNGTLRVYKNSSTTERSSSAGINDTEDFDSLAGVHDISIDTSDNTDSGFYAPGNDYKVVLAGAVIDGENVNHPIFQFSIENRSALMPTTDGRLLDVTATGAAGVDWGNVENPTTTVGLSNTTVKTATDVEADTADIQSRIGSPGVSLAVDLATVDNNVDTLVTRIPNTLSLSNIGDEVDAALAAYDPPTNAELVSEINAVQSDIAALNDLAAADVAAAVWNAAIASYGTSGSYGEFVEAIAPPSAATIADAVLDEALSGHTTNGTVGKALADILGDTNEIQGDLANGGRLDLIFDAILDDTATAGVVLSAAMMNKIADHVIRRNLANARASSDGDTVAFRSLLGAGSKLTNKVAISGSNLNIYDETDAGTPVGVQAVTTDGAAEPITAVDTQ